MGKLGTNSMALLSFMAAGITAISAWAEGPFTCDGTTSSGERVKVVCQDGKYWLDGTETLFSGTTSFSHQGRRYASTVKNGLEQGPFFCWFEHGQKHYEGCSEKGRRHGRYQEWDEKGTLRFDIVYCRGQMHLKTFWINNYTTTETYHLNGKLRSRVEYRNGEILGEVRWWDDQGKEITEEVEKTR